MPKSHKTKIKAAKIFFVATIIVAIIAIFLGVLILINLLADQPLKPEAILTFAGSLFAVLISSIFSFLDSSDTKSVKKKRSNYS